MLLCHYSGTWGDGPFSTPGMFAGYPGRSREIRRIMIVLEMPEVIFYFHLYLISLGKPCGVHNSKGDRGAILPCALQEENQNIGKTLRTSDRI